MTLRFAIVPVGERRSRLVHGLLAYASGRGWPPGRSTWSRVRTSSIAASTHVFKDLVLAAGFFAPFYGQSHWDKNGAFAAGRRLTARAWRPPSAYPHLLFESFAENALVFVLVVRRNGRDSPLAVTKSQSDLLDGRHGSGKSSECAMRLKARTPTGARSSSCFT